MPPREVQVKLDDKGTEAAIAILGKLDRVVKETVQALPNKALYEPVPGSPDNVAKQLDKMQKDAEDIKGMLRKKRAISKAQLDKFVQDLDQISKQMKTTKMRTPGGVGAAGVKVLPSAGGQETKAFDQNLQKIQQTGKKLEEITQEVAQLGKTLAEHADPKHRSWWQKIVDAVVGFVKTCINKLKEWFGMAKGIKIGAPQDVSQQARAKQLGQEAMGKNLMHSPQAPAARHSTHGHGGPQQQGGGVTPYQQARANLKPVQKPRDFAPGMENSEHKPSRPGSKRGR